MKQKYWHKLLSKWRAQKRDGFSIPYIIGSQQFLPSTHNNQNIHELLEDIVNSNGDEIYVTYCLTINDIILGIRDETKTRIAGHFPLYKQNSQSQFFLTNGVNNLGNDILSIASELEERYQSYIDAGEFSMNNRERGDYSAGEIEFIKECFADYFN